MSGVIYDGHAFSELFDVGNPEISILNSMPDLRDVPGRNGSMFVGSRFGNSTVKFAIAAHGSADVRRDKFSTLGTWLAVDEPKKLVLPDTPDRYYMAVPSGSLDLNRAIGDEHASITFALVDPVAYGREVSYTVPSGGSLTFNVGGTFKTYPKVTANAVRNASSLVWGLRLDDGDYLHVKTGNSSAQLVEIDCDERTSTITASKTVNLPTLDSDWLCFAPGTHTLVMDNGTGAATVTFRERWL